MIKSFHGEYRFLSNFWPCNIKYEGIFYKSTENAYQASKSIIYEERLNIASCSPAAAKKIGKNLKIREDWEDVKLKIMYELIHLKFLDEHLRYLLLKTKDEELYEGNWWGDKFWGVDINTLQGENNLGKILMKERERIVNEN